LQAGSAPSREEVSAMPGTPANFRCDTPESVLDLQLQFTHRD
jgi:hypothetical protein